MYHAQHAQHALVSYREMNFSAVWMKVANFFQKLGLVIMESRRKEAERIIAQYQNDHGSIFRSVGKY